MGFSLSWLAVRGLPASDVLTQFGLRATGRTVEVPETPYTSTTLPGGWYLLIANNDLRFFDDANTQATIRRLRADAIACAIEEHVMFSGAKAWRAGKELWSVSHDGSNGGREIDHAGDLPAEFTPLREKASAEYEAGDRDVDYVFEVPVELARVLCGFRHDSATFDTFEVLEPVETRSSDRKGWLRKLFG